MKPVECTSVLTSATTNCKNYSRNVWRFWREELAEKWPIILKSCSMLGDTYNAQKNASIIYLGLVTTTLSLNINLLMGRFIDKQPTCFAMFSE